MVVTVDADTAATVAPSEVLADFSDPYMVWYLVRWAKEYGPDDLVELADAINAALNN